MPTTMSPLRYPGGKSKFYGYVKKLLQDNSLLGKTYIEPFAGGAGLAIKLLLNEDVKRVVINDIDPSIFAFWYSILYNTENFCELILETDVTVTEWNRQREIYLQQNRNNLLELGFATFYLNRTNVSGVIKGGLIGGINQNGKYSMQARFNKENLISKIRAIANYKDAIVLENLDAQELIQPEYLRRFRNVFINFDPPYVKKGAALYRNSFTENDHGNLSRIIKECNRKWIVTYDICPLVAQLYANYRYSYLDVSYSVKDNRKAKEYIFFSNNLNLSKSINIGKA